MRIMGLLHISRVSGFGAIFSSEERGTESRCMDSHQRGAFKTWWAKASEELHTRRYAQFEQRDLLVTSLDDDQVSCERVLFWHRCLPALLVICLWRHQWTKPRFGVIKWDWSNTRTVLWCTCPAKFGYSAALVVFAYVVCCYRHSGIGERSVTTATFKDVAISRCNYFWKGQTKLQVYLESLFSFGDMANAFPWSHCWHFALVNMIRRVNIGNLLIQHGTIPSWTYCKLQILSYWPTSPKCSVSVWKQCAVTACMYDQGKVFHLKIPRTSQH